MAYNKYSIMKGLAIIGVVVGHTGIDKYFISVNHWHLPIFFFISGFFLKEKHFEDPKKYIISRWKRLVNPFLIYALLFLGLHNILVDFYIVGGVDYKLPEYLCGIKNVVLLSSNEELIGAMWFLPALFIVSITCYLCLLFERRTKWSIFWIVLLVGVVCNYWGVPSPYSIWQLLTISWIFMMGYYVSRKEWIHHLENVWVFVGSVVVLIVFEIFDYSFGCQPTAIANQSILSVFAFVAGISMIIYVSALIEKRFSRISNITGFIGEYSFDIMIWHFVGFKIVSFFRSVYDSDIALASFPIPTNDFEIWSPVYIVVGVLFPIALTVGLKQIKYAWNYNRRIQES